MFVCYRGLSRHFITARIPAAVAGSRNAAPSRKLNSGLLWQTRHHWLRLSRPRLFVVSNLNGKKYFAVEKHTPFIHARVFFRFLPCKNLLFSLYVITRIYFTLHAFSWYHSSYQIVRYFSILFLGKIWNTFKKVLWNTDVWVCARVRSCVRVDKF